MDSLMLVFVINSSILQYMTDYLHHVQWYLREKFTIESDILVYNNPVSIADKYTDIIFVQTINSRMLGRDQATPSPTPTRPSTRSGFSITKKHTPFPSVPLSPIHQSVSETTPKPRRLFLLNTEQATNKGYLQRTLNDIKRYNPHVIDYSLENIAILRSHTPNTVFIHLPYPFIVKEPGVKSTAVISLLSSAYRRRICGDLESVADFNGLWAGTRDKLIQKSLILLNVHFDQRNYDIFESIRCYGALEQGTLVISEPSHNSDLVLLKDFIIFSPVENMAETIRDVLDNYQEYYDTVFSEDGIRKMEDLVENVYTESLEKIRRLEYNYPI